MKDAESVYLDNTQGRLICEWDKQDDHAWFHIVRKSFITHYGNTIPQEHVMSYRFQYDDIKDIPPSPQWSEDFMVSHDGQYTLYSQPVCFRVLTLSADDIRSAEKDRMLDMVPCGKPKKQKTYKSISEMIQV